MRFKGLDLNLLTVFEVLLEERSVTRAGVRLHLSPSATSAALLRLRDFFGDPLLTVQGRLMIPTQRAESLRPMVRNCLSEAEALIGASSIFDPATSTRTFRVATSDYAMAACVVAFTHAIAARAPHIGFDFYPPEAAVIDMLDRGEIDLFIAPEAYAEGAHAGSLLFEDDHVVMGWNRHPVFDSAVTQESVLGFGHIAVAFGAARTLSFADRHLALVQSGRRVDMTVASFTIVPPLLIGSARLAIVPGRLAVAMARDLPLRYAPAPFDIPVLREMIRYHHSRARDDGVVWLRHELKLFVRSCRLCQT